MTHTAESDLLVTQAGDGVLVFTGPDGKSPQLDKFEITLTREPEPTPVDKTQLNETIQDAQALDAKDHTDESWAALQEALRQAERVAADANADQATVDAAEQALSDAIAALEDAPKEELPGTGDEDPQDPNQPAADDTDETPDPEQPTDSDEEERADTATADMSGALIALALAAGAASVVTYRRKRS